jgi:hypothetical protein
MEGPLNFGLEESVKAAFPAAYFFPAQNGPETQHTASLIPNRTTLRMHLKAQGPATGV